jgi:hypothetical protein
MSRSENERFPHYLPEDTMAGQTINRLLRIIMGARGINGTRVRVKPNGLEVQSGAGLDLSLFAFGWVGLSETPGYVTINGGPLQASNTTFWIPGADVAVGGDADDHHILYATSPGVIAPVTVRKSSWMGHDETQWRVPLYECHLEEGTPVLDLVLWNVIDLKTWFAAPP